jgi:alpha-D-ribose 1-methylphosphonate 5-triphosphate diphosphatase PhnM
VKQPEPLRLVQHLHHNRQHEVALVNIQRHEAEFALACIPLHGHMPARVWWVALKRYRTYTEQVDCFAVIVIVAHYEDADAGHEVQGNRNPTYSLLVIAFSYFSS